jgi:hyaluronoglucosaminidase
MIANSITFTAPSDLARLQNKIDQLRSIGVHTFMLSFDDVERTLKKTDQQVYGSNYPMAHIKLANHLFKEEKQKDPDFKLWFAPTVYYGLKDNVYFNSIRSHLDPSIQVIWTGSWVLNKTITREQAEQVTALLGRKPLIWDNYPVNDYTYVVNKAPQFFLGPLENRAADLSAYVSGLVANPMIQADASKIALATGGQYLYHPGSYISGEAWNQAIMTTEGIENTEAFQQFCRYGSPSLLNDNRNEAFLRLTDAFWKEYQNGQQGSGKTNLRQELVSLSNLPITLHQNIRNQELWDEINPWLNQLGAEGQVALLALII